MKNKITKDKSGIRTAPWRVISVFLVLVAVAASSFLNFRAAAQSLEPLVDFTNSTPIVIGDSPGPGDSGIGAPYPSVITVAGLSGTVTDVNVRLNGLTHTFPDDIGLLLVGPSGAFMVIQSDAGGGGDVANLTYTCLLYTSDAADE